MGLDSSGRRQNKRYSEELAVQWQRQAIELSDDDWRYAFIRDLSKDGVCFIADQAVAENDLLCFKIKVHFSLWPFHCVGQVVRVKPLNNPRHCEVGVTFLDIDPKDADLIDLLAWEQQQRNKTKETG